MRYALLAAIATLSLVTADQAKCGGGTKCPSDTPCCSSYGQCGVGAYCLGGCDPQNSFDLQSCMAAPTCKSADYKLNSLDGIVSNTKFLGDASQANWVVSGQPVSYSDSVLLTMAPNTVGTLLSSTHYVWYGKISATLSTSQGAGVVTAFIMMSDVKDEIDFEFVGVDLEHAQSNFYYQGITDYHNGANLSVSDTRQNTHTYTIDWQPDSITWSIDGNSMRTLKKSDTWNSTTNSYHYPQTPSRVQLSLWPAGLQSNGQGTVDWAGGLVDWNSQYMQNGYYYARVTDVNVECYTQPTGSVYYYTSTAGTNDTVAQGNNNTILSSFYSTGDNPSYCPGGCSSSVSGQSQTQTSTAAMSATPETVPGVSGGGNAGSSESSSNSGSSGSSGSSNSGSGSSGNSGSSGSGLGGGITSFNQGQAPSTSTTGGTSEASKVVAGSAVALLGFFVAALML